MTLLDANGQNVFYKGIVKIVLESELLTWMSIALCYLNLLEKVRAPHQHHQPTQWEMQWRRHLPKYFAPTNTRATNRISLKSTEQPEELLQNRFLDGAMQDTRGACAQLDRPNGPERGLSTAREQYYATEFFLEVLRFRSSTHHRVFSITAVVC